MPPLDNEIKAVIQLYQLAESQLELLIARGLKSGASGTVRYRRKVRNQVRAILGRLEARAVPRAESLVEKSYKEGAQAVSGPLEGFGQPDVQAINLLADNLTSRLKDGHTIIGRRVDDVFRREGLRAVASKMATAGQAKEAAERLIQALENQGVTAFIDKAGRNWSLENYASMAIRTTSREAASQGTMNQMHRMEMDLVDISHHPHHPDVCDKYDGKTFSLSGNDSEFPKLDQLPPFHPNCKHVMVPSKENYARAARELATA